MTIKPTCLKRTKWEEEVDVTFIHNKWEDKDLEKQKDLKPHWNVVNGICGGCSVGIGR